MTYTGGVFSPQLRYHLDQLYNARMSEPNEISSLIDGFFASYIEASNTKNADGTYRSLRSSLERLEAWFASNPASPNFEDRVGADALAATIAAQYYEFCQEVDKLLTLAETYENREWIKWPYENKEDLEPRDQLSDQRLTRVENLNQKKDFLATEIWHVHQNINNGRALLAKLRLEVNASGH